MVGNSASYSKPPPPPTTLNLLLLELKYILIRHIPTQNVEAYTVHPDIYQRWPPKYFLVLESQINDFSDIL